MKRTLLKLVSCVAVFGFVASSYSLTIIPTFDGSITNDPNGPAMVAAINYAIQVEQSNLVDNVTVKIHFTNDLSVALGQSLTFGTTFPYTNFLAALKKSATSRNDTNGYSLIPNTSTDPLVGTNKIWINLAPARLLGLTSSYGAGGLDSTIMLNMTLMNFSRPLLDLNKYDIAQVAEHEMDEVLGISSDLPDTTVISPIDLFRFTTNLVRTYTTTGDNAYFSPDGTNLLARYNMDPGGDYGDWWSINSPTNWSPVSGITLNYPQVQDAFSPPGNALDLGTAELAALDAVGWTLASTVTPVSVPALKLVRSGANQFTLSWTNTASGYVLQESTNLLNSAAWVASATGSTNPAVLVSTATQKFYRLYNAAASPHVLAKAAVVPSLELAPPSIKIHVSRPWTP
jgi:hypothetical protein